MSSFLCFICHSTVNAETSEESREKYREVVGMNLCPDSQLCHICCHVLNKLSLFRSICLKRSLEYPVLFSEKGTLNLQKSDIELNIVCSDNSCKQYNGNKYKSYQFTYISHDEYSPTDNYSNDRNEYVALEDNRFNDYFNTINTQYEVKEEKGLEDDVNNKAEPEKEICNHDYSNNDNLCQKDELLHGFNDNGADPECNSGIYEGNDAENDCDNPDENSEDVNGSDHYDNPAEDFNNTDVNNDVEDSKMNQNGTKVKGKIKRKRTTKTIKLTVEEQKAELEAQRKGKNYVEAEFKCYNCALPFLFKDTYQAHMMRHEESNGEYKCQICTLRFASPAVLRSHSLIHSRRCRCGSTQRSCGCSSPQRQTQIATCHLCGHMLKDANGLQQHLKRVHMAKTRNRLHTCTVCGESFLSQASLRTHMIKHIKRKFACEQCPAVYSSPYTLAQHRKRHGAREQHFQCDTCCRQYSSRKALLAHRRHALRHQHTVLECPICTKICPTQRSLTLHMQAIHSNSKEHACPHCDACYATRPSLLRHIASHTQKTQVKIAICHLCGNSFKGKSKLNRHLRNVCEKVQIEELDPIYE